MVRLVNVAIVATRVLMVKSLRHPADGVPIQTDGDFTLVARGPEPPRLPLTSR